MLQLKNITKTYVAGDLKVTALSDVSVNFRESEFVAVFGQSGSGKTTLLNIIGGLDRYTTGQLVINGVPTDKYSDKDWDTYRNHSIGFVFQSYNLIPHQSVLANVELALTLSGVSKSERRRRAAEALESVGLKEQMRKKPNQLSGGQMQRVAIARAIVNEPDILLADEPTGALDSETSVQIMEILKEISRDRLIIMVTHNPDLANRYATRTVTLKDGKIIGDTDPYADEDIPAPAAEPEKPAKNKKSDVTRGVKKGKRSMSIFTALSLSLNNLSTKRGRTFMTSFAGSIGIIGIALIMALSNGIQLYINRVQEDTLSSYPITIERESTDLSAIIGTLSSRRNGTVEHDKDAVYENTIINDLMNSMKNIEKNKNDLASFKKYLDREMDKTTSTTGLYDIATVKYSYDVLMNVYTKDADGKIIKSDYGAIITRMMEAMGMTGTMLSAYSGFGASSGSSRVWVELLEGENGEAVNPLVLEQYEIIDGGRWPEKYDEIIVVVDENNEISDVSLYALGLKSSSELEEAARDFWSTESTADENAEGRSWSYDEIKDKTFRVVIAGDVYKKTDGKYVDVTENDIGLGMIYETAQTELKVVGIARKRDGAVAGMINGTIGYTSALTKYIAEKSLSNDLMQKQLADKNTDVFTGLPFKDSVSDNMTDAEKAALAKELISTLTDEEKAALYVDVMSNVSIDDISNRLLAMLDVMDRNGIKEFILGTYPVQFDFDEMTKDMTDEELKTAIKSMIPSIAEYMSASVREEAKAKFDGVPVSELAGSFATASFTDEQYAYMYDVLTAGEVSDATYEGNLKLLGYVSLDDPSQINIYASTFSDKDKTAEIIEKYNSDVPESDKIEYTDYVKLLTSSITTIINVISYVLIAFVAISLVVSSIMIGIITYISVLERTKEIGILRSIGASKRDISRVFNAETLTIGFFSGLIGIGMTLILTLPVNAIIRSLSGIANIGAKLPALGAVILVIISMMLTFIAGLIPSSVAARKDPVTALRTE